VRHSFGLTWFGTGASGTVHGSVTLNQIIKEFAFAFNSAIVQALHATVIPNYWWIN
jgi:hypothetical protein